LEKLFAAIDPEQACTLGGCALVQRKELANRVIRSSRPGKNDSDLKRVAYDTLLVGVLWVLHLFNTALPATWTAQLAFVIKLPQPLTE
jgi:hypothetical protein